MVPPRRHGGLFVLLARRVSDRAPLCSRGVRHVRQILNPLRDIRHALHRRDVHAERPRRPEKVRTVIRRQAVLRPRGERQHAVTFDTVASRRKGERGMRECGEALSLVVARADGLSALICSSEVRARKTQSARSDEIADEHPKRRTTYYRVPLDRFAALLTNNPSSPYDSALIQIP